MTGYSVDLRSRIVSAAEEEGMSKAQAACTFSVSLSSVKRYVKKAERGESLAPKKRPGSHPKVDRKAMKLLEEDLEERPFATLQERRDYVEAVSGISVSRSTICRAIARIGPTRKKGGRIATECDEFLRAAWRVMVAATVEPERLIFVDECGTHTSLGPTSGYAPRGERLRLSVPRRRGKNTTLLSSMSLEGMGPSLRVEGATTALVFEAYVERVLAPSLRPGRVVVMEDNLGAHRPKVSGNSSRRGAASSFTCRATPRTTTRSRRRSPRSRTSFARSWLGARRL